ncbi:MAG: 50S ribosomal protein L10 [Planctomycetia bacterium]|nr:50S ribosomal protein L10 [Planctomycetia bacterium]
MSKYVKNIIVEHLKKKLTGIDNALVVNVIGMEVNSSNKLRRDLVAKGIHLMVVKNSLAARAFVGTELNTLIPDSAQGSYAVCWGASDIVSLAKELVKVSKDKAFAKLELRGGIMDGEAFASDKVEDISKWPTREEQISILLGQIVGVGSKLSSQLLSGGANLASQIKQLADKEGDAVAEEVSEGTAA